MTKKRKIVPKLGVTNQEVALGAAPPQGAQVFAPPTAATSQSPTGPSSSPEAVTS